MLSKTRSAVGEHAQHCDSRSLFQSRFADPQAKDDARKTWFKNLISKNAEKIPHTSWLPDHTTVLYARLMSRLLIDLSGGVMENGNLGFDRYGRPHIPGSAVKGLARSMALQALHDWIDAGTPRPSEEDACAPCCESFENPSDMLAAIAHIFGWTKDDWDKEKNRDKKTNQETTWKSDFAWACSKNLALIDSARALLPGYKTFAGTIAFLPATPNTDPGLELDVLTPHHTRYYEGKQNIATDTEDPVPVFFPAIKAQKNGDYFTFPLIPLPLAKTTDIELAKTWLAHGLELLGLGAKTNAGYGWFDASQSLQTKTIDQLHTQREREKAEELQNRKKAEAAAEALRKATAKAEYEKSLEGLTPDQKEDKKIELLSDEQLGAKLRVFYKDPKKGGPSEEEKKAIIRALRGTRLAIWEAFKQKASKGDLATAANAIRTLNKQLNGDKMP